jgi:hypothetical protein
MYRKIKNDRSSQWALLGAYQDDESLMCFLLTELSAVLALAQRSLHNCASLRKLQFVPIPEEFRQRPMGKPAQSCILLSISRLDNIIPLYRSHGPP